MAMTTPLSEDFNVMYVLSSVTCYLDPEAVCGK